MLEQPYERPCEVLFSDIDVNGQVHHLAYLRYAEAARVHALSEVGLEPQRLVSLGCVVAVLSLRVSYLAPLSFGETVRASARYRFGGGKSFSCTQRLHGEISGEVAGLELVLGLLDTATGRLAEEPRRTLEELAKHA